MENIVFDKKTNSTTAIKRTLIHFVDDAFFDIKENDKEIILDIEPKTEDINISILIKDIKNKVIDEEIRCNIEEETRNIREEIYKKAMNEAQ